MRFLVWCACAATLASRVLLGSQDSVRSCMSTPCPGLYPLHSQHYVAGFDLTTRQFFYRELRGQRNGIHEIHAPTHSTSLAREISDKIADLERTATMAQERKDYRRVRFLLQCSSFLRYYESFVVRTVAAGGSDNEQALADGERMLALVPSLGRSVLERQPYRSAYERAMAVLGDVADHAHVRAQAILASFYARAACKDSAFSAAAHAWLKGIFGGRSDEDCVCLVRDHGLRTACECVAQSGDEHVDMILQRYLYEHGDDHDRTSAVNMLTRHAHKGDFVARCYRSAALLEGACGEAALREVCNDLDVLVSHPEGRAALAHLVRLCSPRTLRFLEAKNKAGVRYASYPLAILLYENKAYSGHTLSLLQHNCSRAPYVHFCLATMYREGLGVNRSFKDAAAHYLSVCMNPSDDDLKRHAFDALQELAESDDPASCAHYIVALVHEGDKAHVLLQPFLHTTFSASRDVWEAVAKFLHEKKMNSLVYAMVDSGNKAACYVAALVEIATPFDHDDLAARRASLKKSWDLLGRVQCATLNARADRGVCALALGQALIACGKPSQAREYLEYAVGVGCPNALRALVRAHADAPDTPAHVITRDLELLKERAENGCVADALELAYLYYVGKTYASGYVVKTDPALAYRYATAVLKAEPTSTAGLYVLARILFEHGGTSALVAADDRAFACLEQSLNQGHTALGRDTCYRALAFCKKGSYVQALSLVKNDHETRHAAFVRACCSAACGSFDEPSLADLERSLLANHEVGPVITVAVRHEEIIMPLVKLLKEHVQSGDLRDCVIFAKMCLLTNSPLLKDYTNDALAALDRAVVGEVASAYSLCAFLHHRGLFLEKSSQKAFLCAQKALACKNICQETIAECLDELSRLIIEEKGPLAIMARYTAVPFLLMRHDASAGDLFMEAEGLIQEKSYDGDKDLQNYAHTCGAWQSMLAAASHDDYVAACLGRCYIARLTRTRTHTIDFVREVETVALPLLERTANKVEFVDKKFVAASCVDIAIVTLGLFGNRESFKKLLKKARTFDPVNRAACFLLADHYRCKADCETCKNPKEKLAKGLAIFKESAAAGNACALVELAFEHIPGCGSFARHGLIKQSMATAISYVKKALGHTSLPGSAGRRTEVEKKRDAATRFLALVMAARLNIQRDPKYTESLIPEIHALLAEHEVRWQSERACTAYGRRLRCEVYSFLSSWAIKEKKWDDAIEYLLKFCQCNDSCIEMIVQLAACYMEKSLQENDVAVLRTCYKEAMRYLLRFIELRESASTATIDIFAHVLAMLGEAGPREPSARTNFGFILSRMQKAGLTLVMPLKSLAVSDQK